MIGKERKPPFAKRKFGNVWGELAYVCKKAHYWLYVRKDKSSATRFLPRLKRLLGQLPENNMAIIRAEGWALFYELQGDTCTAIKYRRREIELMKVLHRDAKAKSYEKSTRAFMLAGRDRTVLQERQRILRKLEEDMKSSNHDEDKAGPRRSKRKERKGRGKKGDIAYSPLLFRFASPA